LTPIGTLLLVVFSVVLGVAMTMRQLFPETVFGAWLQIEGKITTFVVGCLAILFIVEAFLKWLGYTTSKNRSERDV